MSKHTVLSLDGGVNTYHLVMEDDGHVYFYLETSDPEVIQYDSLDWEIPDKFRTMETLGNSKISHHAVKVFRWLSGVIRGWVDDVNFFYIKCDDLDKMNVYVRMLSKSGISKEFEVSDFWDGSHYLLNFVRK